MPPTVDQFEALARAFCPLLLIPTPGWDNPFSMDVFINMVPEDIVDEVGDEFFQIDGEPDIQKAVFRVRVSNRRCCWAFSLLGRLPGIHTNKSGWRITEWREA